MSSGAYYVYILASHSRCIYVGVTRDLVRRTWEHKNDIVEGFTKRYHVHSLVYFEQTDNISAAIAREKQLKRWPRARKERLIEKQNPDWRDLANDWF